MSINTSFSKVRVQISALDVQEAAFSREGKFELICQMIKWKIVIDFRCVEAKKLSCVLQQQGSSGGHS